MSVVVTGEAINHVRLFVVKQAIEAEMNGGMRLTRVMSAHQAIQSVLAPITGKTYKRSQAGKREALADIAELIGE
jgi:hypothetical protein